MARQSAGDAFQTIPSSARAVSERNAEWAQLRARRLQELTHRQQRSEREQCTFQPAAEGSAYLAAIGGGSSLDVVSRTMAWKETRDHRLQCTRQAMLMQADQGRVAPHSRPRASTGAWTCAGTGAEAAAASGDPTFMAPTASASQKGVAPLPTTFSFEDSCHPQLPEWAAPRSETAGLELQLTDLDGDTVHQT